MISAVVLTKNEAKDIEKCLKTLTWCNEIVVIDDYSTDNTVKIAQKYTQTIYKHNLNNNFSAQRNFGLQKAKGEWVLFIDADEEVTKNLKDEILKAVKTKKYNGFYLKRKDLNWGKWLNHGETACAKFLRLAKKGKGEWQNPIHEVLQVKPPTGELKNPILHYSHQTISETIERIDHYSSIRAKMLYNQGKKTNAFEILAYPLGKFFLNYFLRLGLLDGKAGYLMATFMSIHSFLVRAKLYLLWKNKGQEEFKIPSLDEIYSLESS